MGTLKDDVYNSVIELHRKTGKEWIHLKEIYEEVSKFRNEEIKNNGASIRAVLETHSLSSMSFKGKEKFIMKEKGTDLYKILDYDNLEIIKNINIGDTFSREELMSIFKINGQRGMMKTNTLNALVLTTSYDNGIYGDSLIENGLIIYTGEGLKNDQELKGNNKILFESREIILPIYLFTKDKNRVYTFEGMVELYDNPYQAIEKDINDKERLVWKFPLKIKYPNNYNYESNNEEINKLVSKIVELEIAESTSYELVYKEGLPNIRKYRKNGKRINRTNKPNYIAEEIVKSAQGVKSEEIVFEGEIKKLSALNAKSQVKEMKEFFKNKKENEGFDILSFEPDENGNFIRKYIEVKSTKENERTPIDITANEMEFAKEHRDSYYIYRVVYSDSDQMYVKIIKGKELFDKYNFQPTTYQIFSN